MESLTSVDYANLLRFLAYSRENTVLSNTQVNKLLFMCYGTYLALDGHRLFDEAPKAWPFGPVFPKVYKTYMMQPNPIIIQKEKVHLFNDNALAMRICNAVVKKHCHRSAYDLSMWSHQDGSPWHKTVYSDDSNPIEWNKEIEDGIIREYFREHPVAY